MRLTVDHIAIKPLRKAERAVGKIILPSTSQAPFMMWGDVIQVGPGYRGHRSKALWPTFVKAGDRILYPAGAARLAYENLRIDGTFYDEVVFVHERDAGLVLRDGCVYPLYRRIIGHVVEDPRLETAASGLILFTDDVRKQENSTSYVRVKIDHVGFGQRADDGSLVPNELTPGDVILCDKYDAWEYELLDGDAFSGHVILDEDQVLAIDDGYIELSEDEKKNTKIFDQLRGARKGIFGS